MARRQPHDEGFSLLEVMFASFVAFFMLTAIFGVLVASSGEGRIASVDTIATNLAQLAVEQARQLPYDSVGTTNAPSGQPVGVLPALETTVSQGTTFTISRTVVWQNDPLASPSGGGTDLGHDYKMLTVGVSWTGGHTTPIVTYITDHTSDSPPPPIVQWVTRPPANAVLFTDYTDPLHPVTRVWNGSTATPNGYDASAQAALCASASVNATTGAITVVEFTNGNAVIPTPWSGSAAYVLYPANGLGQASPLAIDLAAVDASGVAIFNEGTNMLSASAFTNLGGSGSASTYITVDNTAPPFPAGSVVTATVPPASADRYASKLLIGWTPPMDAPDSVCLRYDLTVQPYNGTATTYLWQDLGTSGSAILATNSPTVLPLTPFTAFNITLRPRSLRGLASNTSASSGYASTAPRLTTVCKNLAADSHAAAVYQFTCTLSTPLPSSALLAAALGGSSISYSWYKADTYTGVDLWNGGGTQVATGVGLTQTDGNTYSTYGKYYQAAALIKNAGGSVIATISSNVTGKLAAGPAYSSQTTLPVTP